MIRIGLVDFDTSHVAAFTQRFNHVDIEPSQHIAGARVVAGWPGDSEMMPERIDGYARQLQSYGVELVDRPEELLGKIDAVMIESQQGARHLERARPFLEAGLPTFVDKPFAGSLAQADAFIALAQQHNAPLMSCSALRYAPEVQAALDKRDAFGPILSADVWGPAALHLGNPGLLHYGIHNVEMLYALMGPGCREVRDHGSDEGQITTGLWPNGQIGMARGLRTGQYGFGFTVHYEKGHDSALVAGGAYYTALLKAIVGLFETGEPPFPLAETREIMAFIDAAARSNARGGSPAPLAAEAGA